uniref:Uncharacterized protein n=1 Tax=Anguilla anguilla TaxID=7936 RepID=A0A0E9XIC6_ANGAN
MSRHVAQTVLLQLSTRFNGLLIPTGCVISHLQGRQDRQMHFPCYRELSAFQCVSSQVPYLMPLGTTCHQYDDLDKS